MSDDETDSTESMEEKRDQSQSQNRKRKSESNTQCDDEATKLNLHPKTQESTAKSAAEISAELSEIIVGAPSTSNVVKPGVKKNAQYCKDYRKRQKAKIAAQSTAVKPRAKTNAQYCKDYRKRQKDKKAAQSTAVKPGVKTNADRCKVFRERRKAKKVAELLATTDNTTNTTSHSPNFNLLSPADNTTNNTIVKYKRPGIRSSGVDKYQNIKKLQHVITQHAGIYAREVDLISTHSSSVGDLCAEQCLLPNGKTVIMVSIYISSGKSIDEIQDFIHHALLPYTEGGSKLLKKNYHNIPMIFAGDFNVNFDSEDSLQFIQFLKDILNLEIVNDKTISRTRYETTIDAVFSRFIDNLSANNYVSHFSYLEPIVTIIEKDDVPVSETQT